MIVGLYAVKDTASGVYDGPYPALADGVALRDFTNYANNKDSKIGMNPEHFSLWRIGSWNDALGTVADEEGTCLAKAIDLIGGVN